MSTTAARIKDGIEYFDGPDDREECQCARCGSSTMWEDCHECGGDGYINRHEEDAMWYDEDDMSPCSLCGTKGGWAFCMSSREWCEANPTEGREDVKSTARESKGAQT